MKTIEEKAKAYDEALNRAKALYCDGAPDSLHLVSIFPELAESEDERIRKALIEYLTTKDDNAYYVICGVSTKKIIAWLEKQGQVKESTISQHEKKTSKENDNSLTNEDKEQKHSNLERNEEIWSEYDEKEREKIGDLLA